MLWKCLQLCYISKIMLGTFIIIFTISINSIFSYFAESNAFASHAFCSNVKTTYSCK